MASGGKLLALAKLVAFSRERLATADRTAFGARVMARESLRAMSAAPIMPKRIAAWDSVAICLSAIVIVGAGRAPAFVV